MSSLLRTKGVQIGQDNTATNNFTLYQPGVPDGTLRIGNGNSGSTTDLVTMDSNGNVGIGTTPPAWRSPQTVLSIGPNASVSQYSNIATVIASNMYTDSTDTTRYIQNLGVIAYSQRPDIGEHIWSNAPSGVAGNPVTLTQRMKINSSGYVTMPYQPHIMGSPTNTSGAGIANSFATTTSQGGLTFANSRITVPVTGIYLITFNTICDNTTGRVDAKVWINGGESFNTLSEDNGQGHHYRGVSNAILLQANDYIQFDNNDWYDAPNTGATQWRTASVTLIG